MLHFKTGNYTYCYYMKGVEMKTVPPQVVSYISNHIQCVIKRMAGWIL